MAQRLDFLTQAEAGADHLAEQVVERVAVDTSYKNDELLNYMSALRHYPVLREAEDFNLLYNQYITATTEAIKVRARDLIIYGNIRLVLSVAMRLSGRGLGLLDMMQEGVIGMMTALGKFDPNHDRGAKFSTYATWWIRQAILRAIVDYNEKRPFRIPVHLAEQLPRVAAAIEQFFYRENRWPNDYEVYQEIQARTDLKSETKPSLTTVIQARRTLTEGYTSFDGAEYSASDDEGNMDHVRTMAEVIGDPSQQTEIVVEARTLLADLKNAFARIEEALQQLSMREAMILRWRLGLDTFECMTLEDVATRYDLTRERIRQIEGKALEKLQQLIGLSGEELQQLMDAAEELAQIASVV